MRLAPLALASLLVGACPSEPSDELPPVQAASAPVEPLEFEVDQHQTGLRIRLSEAHPLPDGGPAVPPAEAVPLTDAEVVDLLARVPDLEAQAGDRATFALRPSTEPIPRTGATVHEAFPPPTAPPVPEVDAGELRVLRHAPAGEVPLAPHLSVTFSQPMVAVTTQDEAARSVPVQLSPEPPGQWRWVGTRTVLFEPDPRFPMATVYEVQVPAGTASATGLPLELSESWTFSTPPLQVSRAWPSDGPWPLDPLVFLEFDQRIDPEALLPSIHLRTGRGQVPLRLATDAEIEADAVVRKMVESTVEGRSLVLHPVELLRPDTTYSIDVDAGAPSAEGPRTTASRQSTSFTTYPPLRMVDDDCARGLDGCVPGGVLWVWFNNPLDEAAFDPATVVVAPELEDASVVASGTGLSIYGDTRAETRYTVTIPAALTDTFGQQLGKDRTVHFEVGHAHRSLRGPDQEYVVLDPSAPPAISVYSTNHESVELRVYAVEPSDWPAVSTWMRESRYHHSTVRPPPFQQLASRTVPIELYEPDELIETALDLSPWLDKGHLFVWIQPTLQSKEPWERIDLYAWVQRTELGLTALVDEDEVLVWATSLADGTPLPGVEVSLLGRDGTEPTDTRGLARLEPYAEGHSGPHGVVAERSGDRALLPENTHWYNDYGSWFGSEGPDELVWFVFDDRAMYRPGEEVHVKGWLRRFETRAGGEVGGLVGAPTTLDWTARDAHGNPIGTGEVQLGELGGFDLAIPVPDTPALGHATLELTARDPGSLGSAAHWHGFQIQEFRRPEFEVTATVDPRPYLLGEHAYLTASAAYYAGGALPSAPVDWQVTWHEAAFSPPNHSDYRFGDHSSPWWWGDTGHRGAGLETLSGQTDPLGNHTVKVDFLALNPPVPMSVQAEATVVDVNRQRWTASTGLLLHPAAWYVGVKPDRGFYEQGQDVEVEAVVVDLDGRPVAGVPMQLTLSRLEWVRVEGTWTEVHQDPVECALTSAAEAKTCTWTLTEGGSHQLVAEIVDEEGRPNRTRTRIWVTGGTQPPQRQVAEQELVLIPDAETYQPGDVAELMVQSPFYPGHGLLSLRRDGLMHTEVFSLEGPSTTLQVPIASGHVPNLFVEVDLVGSAVRTDDDGEPLPDKARRVAFATGSLVLPVPPLERTLAVEVLPHQSALEPGGSTAIQVRVRDAEGSPVRAEVALVAADEAVLALSGYTTPDPLAVFYAPRPPGVYETHLRHSVVLADPLAVHGPQQATPDEVQGVLGALGNLDGEGGGGAIPDRFATITMESSALLGFAGSGDAAEHAPPPAKRSKGRSRAREPEPIAVRQDFSALALWAPRASTDADGVVEIPVDLPDSLTRYRVMAVAVSGEQLFGSGEATLTARQPLMLRPSPPRFLNFGDRMELPLVVQNQTDSPVEVDLAVRMTNAAVIPDLDSLPGDDPQRTAGRRLSVPANDRREVRIPVAADMAGTARFQAVVVAGRSADAASFELPVWTPATSEAFATYGELDEGAVVQPVTAPADVWAQFGGLELTTSSTALQALTDAVLYLSSYPYDCTEQISSRMLAVAALRDVLAAFESEQLPPAEVLEGTIVEDIERLQRRQLAHGGWSFWPRMPDNPWVTIHTAHALVRAREAGWAEAEVPLRRARSYLADIESHIPSWYSDEARWTVIAYSVWVRHLDGDDDLVRARCLARVGLDRLPLEAQAWILPVLHAGGESAQVAAMLRHWENRVSETAATAQFDVSYTDESDYVLLHSSRRTDGVLLESLIEVHPDHDVIPKVVRGLLDHRTAGRWSSTQENAFVLLAMNRYFRTYEAETPDFVARAWLGEDYAGDHAFRGRTTERARIDIPMGWLVDPSGTRDLVLAKEGPGRLYYRIGMRYAPRDLRLDPADRGFSVERTYAAIDDPRDVSRDPDGTWHIRSGARVRVRLTMVAPARRTHVALVDPLPAGLEPMNPVLAVTGSVPEDPTARSGYWWWSRTWYEHQAMRDERVEAFTTLLWAGVHDFSYVATATTPGRFVVPPPKAEEMYHPETFGRGATAFVVVE